MITITYQHGYKITYLQYYMLHYSNTHHTNLWEVMICFCPSQQPLLTRQSTNNINVILHQKCTLRFKFTFNYFPEKLVKSFKFTTKSELPVNMNLIILFSLERRKGVEPYWPHSSSEQQIQLY